MALFKCFKSKAPLKFSLEKLHGWNPWKFSPANLSDYGVLSICILCSYCSDLLLCCVVIHV